MLKRTKGYFLLTLLVLTGLAGRVHSDILPGKERRYLVQELKISKTSLLQAIDGLSPRQLDYKPGKNDKSIKQCIYELACLEERLWMSTRSCLNSQSLSDRRPRCRETANGSITASNCISSLSIYKSRDFKNVADAVKCFRQVRSEQVLYAKTTTDNPARFSVLTPAGYTDAYQAMLLCTTITRSYVRQIQKLIDHPSFPR